MEPHIRRITIPSSGATHVPSKEGEAHGQLSTGHESWDESHNNAMHVGSLAFKRQCDRYFDIDFP